MNLDELPIVEEQVGWGVVGLGGDLGYEGKPVSIRGENYVHSISAHAPSRLVFDIGGKFTGFRTHVALNDDVASRLSSADFAVVADGRTVAYAREVSAGASPVELTADVYGAQRLELVVSTRRWDSCHAIWVEPELSDTADSLHSSFLPDCLERARILIPTRTIKARRCIATVVSPGYADWLDDMLGSLHANGCCQDAQVVVFAVDADEACRLAIAKYDAITIDCVSTAPVRSMVKSVLYSVARVVEAEEYLCLDADTLVFGDLTPLFGALEAAAEGSILACSDDYIAANAFDLEQALCNFYQGESKDLPFLLDNFSDEGRYPLVVNDGVFAGGRTAMLALDAFLRSLAPQSITWMERVEGHGSRNQFLFNLALASLKCGVPLDKSFNLMTVANDVEHGHHNGCPALLSNGKPVRILHFAGAGRERYEELRGCYARVPDPLLPGKDNDYFQEFIVTLRKWVGLRGRSSLSWSFYGTTDGNDGFVRDAVTFPLYAALHYLIRSNGCIRVLEAGTGKGVSTACIAAAVAGHSEGRVVSMDIGPSDERSDLWATLPAHLRSRIDERRTDSLQGMSEALVAGERYEAALLDSLHEAKHVWCEFQLATQLVCPGGLILIHDSRYRGGNVEEALQAIERSGYTVARLWSAEGGFATDDHLGLALIENRQHY